MPRIRDMTTRRANQMAWQSPGSSNTFVMDDGKYRLDGSSWGRFHPTTTYVGAWYLSEVAASPLKLSLQKAMFLDRRPSSFPLFVDRFFEQNGEWEETVPHNNMGIVRVATDGHADFLGNPWRYRVMAVPYGSWTPANHPWSQGAGGQPNYDQDAIKPM